MKDAHRRLTAAVINLGCKVNKYESDLMKQKLADAGVMIVDPEDVADIYIVNTCSVTNIAERKSRQMLRRAKRRNPDALVVAAGCYVNAAQDDLNSEEYVDVVIGNNCKKNIVEILSPYMKNMGAADDNITDNCVPIDKEKEYEEMGHLNASYMDHCRAYIKIQDGCNQFCSYCIIPYTRGRVRSRKPEYIIDEIKGLAKSGVKEFVLTGIHISSYGADFDEEQSGIGDLGDLICAIAGIEKVLRIRLGSLEPRIITEEFLQRISGIDKLCPHFHLSLQSACNATLKRMNRKYTVEEFVKVCDLLREYYVKPALTTDVIVGFPGETEKEFEETYDNLCRIGFYEIHVFKYSIRNGTMAADMADQVPEITKNDRSDRLLGLTSKQKKEYEESLFGLTDTLLIEEVTDDSDMVKKYTGHTSRYVKVVVEDENNIINEIIPYTF